MALLKKLYLFFGVSIFVVITGCAPNRIYKTDYRVCTVSSGNSCDKHFLQKHNAGADDAYMLGFVEFDDQGQLRDQTQMKALMESLYKVAANDRVLINVFVHGWHSNAGPDDPNIENFKKTLARLSKVESDLSLLKHRAARKVIGIYIGWRGESITVPVVSSLTFWERKNTALKVGHLGLTELLLALEKVTQIKNSLSTPVKSSLVVIGHSFGGAVVYSSIAQILASRFIDSQADNDTAAVPGFGDLVILLNPAFEALNYLPIYELGQLRCRYSDNQVPRLVILTSEADDATKLAFPAGRLFSTFFETYNIIERKTCNYSVSVDESESDRKTVGHYLPLISHTLASAGDNQETNAAGYINMKNIWSDQSSGGSVRIGSTVLTHLDKTEPLNPYLNIRAGKELIPGHNDVFGDKVTEFLRLLIELSTGG
jgi:hypothetical protein